MRMQIWKSFWCCIITFPWKLVSDSAENYREVLVCSILAYPWKLSVIVC